MPFSFSKQPNLLIESLTGGVHFLLQPQQRSGVLLLHDGEVSIVLLSRFGQHVGAAKLHHLLLHAVHRGLGHPQLLLVLQVKTFSYKSTYSGFLKKEKSFKTVGGLKLGLQII